MAGVSDWNGLKIPNRYSLIIGVNFFACFGMLWVLGNTDVFSAFWVHLLAGMIIFVVTVAMFFMKIMGAADSKLASVFALWIGMAGLPVFLFVMTLIGAVLSVAALIVKKYKPVKNPKEGSWIAQLQQGVSKVPYGIAIGGGALYAFFSVGYFDFEGLAVLFGL